MNKTNIRCVLFGVILFSSVTVAATRRVPSEYFTIQTAILAANHADTVLVSPGTYVENICFLGKRIRLISHYSLSHDSSVIAATIIDGSQPSNPDTASTVRMVNGEDSTTVLEGFTIRGGQGTPLVDQLNGQTYVEGGGILCENSSPVIRFNVIIENQATRRPAGVSSAGGGGIRTGFGAPTITNNLIAANQGRYGAGIVVNYAHAIIKNNIICMNSGGQDYAGSGVWLYGSTVATVIENNAIVGNTSTLGGAGIYTWSNATTIRNNIVWGNRANVGAQQLRAQGGTVSVSYCDVSGGFNGVGNINVYPRFRATQLYLAADSPCIDAGDPDSAYTDPVDMDGFCIWPGQGTPLNDMGAYGGHLASPFPWFAYPVFSVPSQVNFGQVDLGDSAQTSVALSNMGTTSVRVDSAVFDYGMQFGLSVITTLPLTISPFSADTLRLNWAPISEFAMEDSLSIYYNDTQGLRTWRVRILGNIQSPILDPSQTQVPEAYSLTQNFPNPFNSATTLRFTLPLAGHVRLNIFNTQGQLIARLADDFFGAGEHSVNFNSGNLASSLYFCVFEVGSYRGSVKMILLK
jgi:hypothetical protein